MGLFGKSKAELFEWQKILSPNTNRLVYTETELKAQSVSRFHQSMKIIQDSISLCNTTRKPSVFFKRWDIMISHMEILARLEKYIRFTGDSPSGKLQQFQSVKEAEIDRLIDRAWEDTLEKVNMLKTTSAKLRRVESFKSEFDEYAYNMTSKNIDKYESFFDQFELKE